MSISPANMASMAEGPALKLFHSILTFGSHGFLEPAIGFAHHGLRMRDVGERANPYDRLAKSLRDRKQKKTTT